VTDGPRDPEANPVVVRPRPAVIHVREALREIYPSLTRAEIEQLVQKLRRDLRADLGSPASIATTIEPIAPSVAKRIRSYTDPEMLKGFIELLTAVLILILTLWNMYARPPLVPEITQIFDNIETTHVTNFPPPPHDSGADQDPATPG
jgi:hypothetical protein